MKIKADDKDTTAEGCMDDDEAVRRLSTEMSQKLKTLQADRAVLRSAVADRREEKVWLK